MGYVQQNREEMEILFTLLAERYERSSVLLSSNLPFSKWEGIFKDPMTPVSCGKRRSLESEENQQPVSLSSHRPWKSRTTRGIPLFPQPRLLLISVKTMGKFVCR